MKRFCLSVFAVASMLLAASCQQELNPVTDGDTTVTFTVNAGDVATRADIADGTNIDALHWEIYKTDDVETAIQPLGEDTIIDNDGNKEFTVELKLLADQKYTIIFWAEVDGAGHYDTGDLRNVGMNYKQENGANIIDANDESRAAFFRVYPFETENGETINETIELYRPFSQLNLGATTYETSFNNVNEGKVKIEASEIKVTNVATTFNTIHLGADGKYGQGTGKIAATFLTGDNTLRTPNEPADDTQKLLEVNDLYYYWLGMNYLIVSGENTDNVDVDITLDTNFGEVKHTISSVPVKENYRTNLLGNFLTTGATFNVVVDEEFNKPDEVVVVGSTVVRTSDELVAALKEDKEHINIFLDEVGNVVTRAGEKKEFEIAIGAWTEKYYFGGASTKTITINANGNKINFVHENGDWNYIRCVNDAAKWIINDATLTNSGENDGPWNRHDIRFYNAVELNNVTSDKAIALLNDGKLNDVQISDVHPESSEAYGLWITAEGQTVSLDGVTITPSEGKTTDRAIKIAGQYVDSPAKVTLNVSNSKFVSQKKAAVLVTSPAGALINWGEGNDIKGVAADPINAVWVDEDYEEYASEVEVKGASKVVEGAVENVPASDQEALKAALDEAAKNPETTVVVNVAADTYGTLPALSSNVVLNCAEGTVFEGTSSLNVNGATVIGATFEDDGIAVRGTVDGTFKNCTFDGSEALRWCDTEEGDEILFEDCVIKTDFRGFHFDGMEGNVTFRRCEINGFNAYGGKGTATFENCVFGNDESSYNGLNTYSNTVLKDCQFVFNTGKTNFIDMEGTGKTLSITNCTATLDGTETPVIDFVGGSQLANNTVILDGKTYASSQTSLSKALENGATDVLLKDGNYTMPEPDLRGKGLTITGSKDVVIDATAVDARDQFVTGATLKFEGVTLNFGKVNYMGFANTASLTYKDCNINGLQFLFGENVVFENCSLDSNGAEHTVWTYGVKNVSFTDCDFTYGDRGVNCYSDNDVPGGQTVNFTNCTFATENTASAGAVEINSCFISEGIVVNMEGCTAPAYGEMAYVSPWDSTNGAKTTINIK